MSTDHPHFEFNRGGSFNLPRDWSAFEHLTRDLLVRLLGDEHVDLNGRSGQPQAGIDVWGTDRQTGQRVGIQCKGRSDAVLGESSALSLREFLAAVEKAKCFVPPIDSFILLTTGPNDVRLKQAARELSEAHAASGLFTVAFHGWDWIEGKLDQHVDLAARYGLVAVVHPAMATAGPASQIAVEIGARLTEAIAAMNRGREGDKLFTLQGLARHAGHSDWRRLEDIALGAADADEAELRALADALALNPVWLIEGKGAPFDIDAETGPRRVEQLYDAIVAMKPQRIVFVRQRDGGHGHHDAFIAVERDALRWFIFRDTHPACDRVGGGGSHDLLELCRLMRRFDHEAVDCRILCHGRHLDSPEFEQVLEGEVYPGSVLDFYRHDRWWEGFAALRLDWIDGDGPHWTALRNAIGIVEHRLARARTSARTHAHAREALAWGRFRETASPSGEGPGEPWP